jgi:NADH-ubiquinone/plastoquinone oxidoreductase chain 6.
MIDLLLLSAALFFGLLTVYSRDNVYSAVSLASAAGAVGAYYAYLAQFASAFLIFVIYIGAVMLLVLITAAMYGGVQRWGGRYFLTATLLFLAAAVLGIALWSAPPARPVPAQLGDLLQTVMLLIGVAAASLVVSVEVAKRV